MRMPHLLFAAGFNRDDCPRAIAIARRSLQFHYESGAARPDIVA